MFNLNNIFSEEKDTCKHRYPDIEFIADLMDREEKKIRSYFCSKCKDYRWKYPETSRLSEDELSELRKNKFFLYCTSKSLTSLGETRRG